MRLQKCISRAITLMEDRACCTMCTSDHLASNVVRYVLPYPAQIPSQHSECLLQYSCFRESLTAYGKAAERRSDLRIRGLPAENHVVD